MEPKLEPKSVMLWILHSSTLICSLIALEEVIIHLSCLVSTFHWQFLTSLWSNPPWWEAKPASCASPEVKGMPSCSPPDDVPAHISLHLLLLLFPVSCIPNPISSTPRPFPGTQYRAVYPANCTDGDQLHWGPATLAIATHRASWPPCWHGRVGEMGFLLC